MPEGCSTNGLPPRVVTPPVPEVSSPHRLDGAGDTLQKLRADYLAGVWSLGVPGLGQLALLPLLVATLTPRELGALALIEAVMVPAATLGMMGLKFAYLFRYPSSDRCMRGRLFATCLLLGSLLSVLMGLVVALPLMTDAVWQTAGFDEPVMTQPLLLVCLLVTATLHGLLLTWWRAERAIAGVTLATWAQLLGQVLVGGVTIAWAGWGVDGLYVGYVVGNLAAITIMLRAMWKTGASTFNDWQPDLSETKMLLTYGAPLAMGLLVRYGMDSVARLLLVRMVSFEAAAVWLVMSRIISLFEVLVSNPFLMAWGGLMHHVLRLPDAVAVLKAVSGRVLFWSTLAALLLTLAHQPLLTLLAEGYQSGHAWLFVCLLAVKWLVVVKAPLTSGVYLRGDTAWATRNNLQSLMIFLLVGPLLATGYDAEGLAAAIVLATLIPAVWLWRESRDLLSQKLVSRI
jgi:O-antigen/teichoic acid export membrane protein